METYGNKHTKKHKAPTQNKQTNTQRSTNSSLLQIITIVRCYARKQIVVARNWFIYFREGGRTGRMATDFFHCRVECFHCRVECIFSCRATVCCGHAQIAMKMSSPEQESLPHPWHQSLSLPRWSWGAFIGNFICLFPENNQFLPSFGIPTTSFAWLLPVPRVLYDCALRSLPCRFMTG